MKKQYVMYTDQDTMKKLIEALRNLEDNVRFLSKHNADKLLLIINQLERQEKYYIDGALAPHLE